MLNRNTHLLRPLFSAALALLATPMAPLQAAGDEFLRQAEEFNYDDSEDIPWIENETEVLAMPAEEDLSRVNIDFARMPEGMELLIDKKRIDVNPKDRVVRVWLWVRGEGGANNITYEGFRCATGEYKIYAYANPRRDPPVSKAKNSRWIKAKDAQFGNYRRELMQDYFCEPGRLRDADQIRNSLTGEYRPNWRWTTN